MTAYAYSDTDDVTEKANIDRAAVERLERDPYGSKIAMTDEERQELTIHLRQMSRSLEFYSPGALRRAADEIKRLAEELRITNKALSMCSDECNKAYERYDKKLDEIERLNLELRHERDVRAEAERGCVNMAKEIERLAALAQSDAEPVAWPDIDAAEKAGLAWRNPAPDAAPSAYSDTKIVTVDGTAPPRPDASAGLIEAAEWHEEQVKKYKKHGGFSMRELELFHNEAAAALRARAADRSGK
jgi:hypothetical protein